MELKELAENAIKAFDFSKYAQANKLDASGWFVALRMRHDQLDAIQTEWLRRFLPAIIDSVSHRPLDNWHWHEEPPSSWRTVSDVQLVDAWEARKIIGQMKAEGEACRAWEIEMNTKPDAFRERLATESESDYAEAIIESVKEDQRRRDPVERVAHSSYNAALSRRGLDTGGAFAYVDLNAPDSVIVEHFKEWLRQQRVVCTHLEQCRTEIFREADFGRWAQHRVLAYLDLAFLAKVAEVRLSQHKMGQLIFPDLVDVDLTEKIRKTTAPLAEQLMADDALQALWHQQNEQRAGKFAG